MENKFRPNQMKSSNEIFTRMLAVLLPIMILKESDHERVNNDLHQYSTLSLHQAKEDSTKLSKEKTTNIYFTIDDGPSPASFYLSNTAMADSVYLTMFIIGDSVFQNKSHRVFFDLYQLNPFIETGNHSFSHANSHYKQYYQNVQTVLSDFRINADSLHINNKIARLPGRNTWRINGKARTDLADADPAADRLQQLGYNIVGWDIEWKTKQDSIHSIEDAGRVINKINRMERINSSFTANNIVLLCHENMFIDSINRIQFEKFINNIKRSKHYTLKALHTYPGIQNHLQN